MQFIKVCFQIPGVHYYTEASGSTEYLKHPHRHIFHFTVWIQVIENSKREIEFIQIEERLRGHMLKIIEVVDGTDFSCELLASQLLNFCVGFYSEQRAYRVEVTEDGLNGVLLEREGM